MNNPQIKIKEETFRLDFSLLAFRCLGKKWGLKSISEVMAKVATLDTGSSELDFDLLDMFAEVFVSFVNSAEGNSREINEKEILRLPIGELMVLFQSFTEIMIDSVQSETSESTDEVGKGTAVKNSRKKSK